LGGAFSVNLRIERTRQLTNDIDTVVPLLRHAHQQPWAPARLHLTLSALIVGPAMPRESRIHGLMNRLCGLPMEIRRVWDDRRSAMVLRLQRLECITAVLIPCCRAK